MSIPNSKRMSLFEVAPADLLPHQLKRPAFPTAPAEAVRAAELVTLWRRFSEAMDVLMDESDELPIEEFATVFSLYRQLQEHGINFNESFASEMEELHRAMAGTDDDSDADDTDEALDHDDESDVTSYRISDDPDTGRAA